MTKQNIKFHLLYTLIILILSKKTFSKNVQFPHPLDPLTPEEIQDTVSIIQYSRPSIRSEGNWTFNWITLQEPEKSLLLPYFLKGEYPPFNTKEIPRESFTVLVEKKKNIVHEVVVNLFTKQVKSWTQLAEGTHATFTAEDNDDAEEIAKSDPDVQERCREMGWANMSLVTTEVWGVAFANDRLVLANALRPIQMYFYGKMFDGDNHYAHPFDFVVTVDLAVGKVLAIDNLPTHDDYNAADRLGNTCPKLVSNYDPQFAPPSFRFRTDLHSIHFSQPAGASYQIRGNEVTWQKFNFRVGFSGREGLIIHQISYKDGDVRRPLFYRNSVAELFIPYGDARPPFHQKYPFDMGEFSLGYWAVNHKASGICRGGGVVHYFDFNLNNEDGEVTAIPAAVCIYEEDAGILWAHQMVDGEVVHARSQRLTVQCMVNEGNYDYIFSWRFYQDATIEFTTQLHGSISSQLLAQNVTDAGQFGRIVFPQINGQFHQHHVALRLDAEIDGNINTVSTVDVVPLSEPTGSQQNPYGNGFTTEEKLLKTPEEARTRVLPLSGRSWLIKNPEKIHSVTQNPVAYKLVPYNAPLPFVRKDSPLFPRSAFTEYNVWVTKFKEGQMYPGGFYLNGSGLPQWVRDDPNADLSTSDVVLWYIYGFTHIPRTEDFPLLTVESTGFVLKPTNFFLQNPAMDIRAPSTNSSFK